jgi:SAM-dependent methyltransferase
MSEWPGKGRREATPGEPTYALRAPLAAWVRDEARRAHEAYGRYRLLDVGCGVKPYHPFFAPYVTEHVGVDIDNPDADLTGTIEQLPVEDETFDIVLCTQVLEHCVDPAQAVRELYRVTKPGGRVLASTHGVYVYHPAPTDHWRWTHTGLERLFRTGGEWASVTVTPAAGTTATLGMLIAIYVDLVFKNLRVRGAGRPLTSAINRLATAIDARSAKLREIGPGSLIANYHVLAVK